MSNTIVYTLKDFNNIIFDGFNFTLPEPTVQLISSLSLEVGSPTYIKTPVFTKRENPLKTTQPNQPNLEIFNNNKKKKSKNMEINDEDWEAIRNFQTTKIEQKVGVDAHIDIIRSNLNKITDKNYEDTKNKIVELLNQIISENVNEEEIIRISSNIFEIASTNRFYSKIYADLYTDLINNYEPMKKVFEDSFNKFLELFNNIEYVEPTVDYDKFCKINKDNEKRKALSAFFINLMCNNIITKDKILNIVKDLLSQVYNLINIDGKKNEVDELTENIILLFKSELFKEEDYTHIKFENGLNIMELIESFANSKVKDYKSLTNKSIFKYMDMIEM